jgi:hypothetical protein
MSESAYPLQWPASWARTKYRVEGRFGNRAWVPGENGTRRRGQLKDITVSTAVDRLMDELRKLDADWERAVLSTNMLLRMDGLPRSGQSEPADPGAAVYFTLGKQRLVLACDKWTRVADNIAAIAAHIGALRGQQRWGVGSVEQAFLGYQALPPPGGHAKREWWQVLGFEEKPTREVAEAMYRRLAKEYHPDNPTTGNAAMMAEVNAAMDECRA